MTSGISKVNGFDAVENNDGTLTIKDVPIFVTCERGEMSFDRTWLTAAVSNAKVAEREGYLPPLHVRHHKRSDEPVQAAGHFRITGVKMRTFKGERKPAIMADLIITNPAIAKEVVEMRLPYRSVEIFNMETPKIDGLALLDHEAPFLELPMLVVRKKDREPFVSGETFSLETAKDTPGVLSFFQRGNEVHVLMSDEPNSAVADPVEAVKNIVNGVEMAEDSGGSEGVPPTASGGPASEQVGEAADKPDEIEGEVNEEGAMSSEAQACVEAIESGAIPIREFAMIKNSIEAAETKFGGGDDPAMDPNANPAAQMPGMAAPAGTPGAAMSKETETKAIDPIEFARIKGESEANAAAITEMRADSARENDITGAMTRLKDRQLGSDLGSKLTAFHKDHGPEAFEAYVTGLESSVAPVRDGDPAAGRFGTQIELSGETPACVLAFEKDGVEKMELAMNFAREWQELHETGHTRHTQEAYVEKSMNPGVTIHRN